jgi:uncharacterized protein with ATP-grasp and redox domains
MVAELRMASGCYPCILDRAKFESDLVLTREDEKKGAIEELLDFMACHKGGVPALVGTERERIIKRRSQSPDPYRKLKEESNQLARSLLPIAREFFHQSESKLEALIRIAAAANSMEFGVKGHDFDTSTFGAAFAGLLEERLEGDLAEVERLLDQFGNIFYLTDNSGEAIFDLFVVEKLEEMGKRVVMGAKSEPIINDVTAEELRAMGEMEVVATGPVVGTTLESLSPAALDILEGKEWLILAKGMGNYETISEFQEQLEGRLIYVFRAKCEPVAMSVGAPRGSLVVKTV